MKRRAEQKKEYPRPPFKDVVGPFYIYRLVDPRTGKTIYVGRGTGRRAKTYYTMASMEKYLNPSHNKQLNAWISEIRSCGMEVGIYSEDFKTDKKGMQAREKELIKEYGRHDKGAGGSLANRNNGG